MRNGKHLDASIDLYNDEWIDIFRRALIGWSGRNRHPLGDRPIQINKP